MKRLTIYCLTCLIGVSPLFAQQGVTQCGTPTGQPKFPIETYQELPDPSSPLIKTGQQLPTLRFPGELLTPAMRSIGFLS